eukprot:10535322-Prorocentrum_lima.AAC.1
MTSSLVGSEMCIRDRNSVQYCRKCNIFPDIPGDDHIDTSSQMGSLDPVSYTHLTLPTICSV